MQNFKPKVAVLTLFPEMFAGLCDYGISGRALERGLLEIKLINPRDFARDRHQTVDDRPYGGGPGMVMLAETLSLALESALQWLAVEREQIRVVYLSPQGRQLSTSVVAEIGNRDKLVLICGRYEGIDERFISSFVDEEISIGDYVLSGGELPAMVLLDAMIRRLPGALGDENSAEEDSFEAGLLDCPHYTRPEVWRDREVPAVLLSGDHAVIRRWRLKQSLGRTWQRRPELLAELDLAPEQKKLLLEFQSEQDGSAENE